jgi:hypothetical protein
MLTEPSAFTNSNRVAGGSSARNRPWYCTEQVAMTRRTAPS